MLTYQFLYRKTAEAVGRKHDVRTVGLYECRATLTPNDVRDGYWQVGRIEVRDVAGQWFELEPRDPLHKPIRLYVSGCDDHQAKCDELWFARHPPPQRRFPSQVGATS